MCFRSCATVAAAATWPDGVAPMSLMTYTDAFPWAEAVRAEMIAGHMPPWHAQEGAVRFKNAPTITAAEIDKILVWVSGGNPQGNPQNVPRTVALRRDWPAGKPDLVLQLPEAVLWRQTNPRSRRSSRSQPGPPSRSGSVQPTCCPARRRSCAMRPFR